MAATGDRVPCVYVQNHNVVGLDPKDPLRVDYNNPFPGELNGVKDRASLKLDWSHGHNNAVVNGIGRIGYFTGGKSAQWVDEDMADTFTKQAVGFIEREKDHPFFLYVPESLPHVPLAVSDKFKGKSGHGLYADVIEEIDASTGRILDALEKQGRSDDTIVIFTSDNGPWLSYGDHAGSAGPLREGKGTTWEGGVRVPCLMRWPGKLPAGTRSNAMVMTIDLLPTLAAWTGAKVPAGPIDGANIGPLLLGQAGAHRKTGFRQVKGFGVIGSFGTIVHEGRPDGRRR